jgi:CheY-like chemotaxis protein
MFHDHAAPIVLVVEDEWLVREEIAHELQDAGWNVLEASTGEGAVALLRQGQQVDAVVTDIRLAGYLSGWDVAEAFRAVHPDIPVIYASGTTGEKSRRVPNSVFFTKPYRTAEVLKACRTACQVSDLKA